MQWTDKRVGLMNEIINSMSMIKFMAWEHPFRVGVTGCVSYVRLCVPVPPLPPQLPDVCGGLCAVRT